MLPAQGAACWWLTLAWGTCMAAQQAGQLCPWTPRADTWCLLILDWARSCMTQTKDTLWKAGTQVDNRQHCVRGAAHTTRSDLMWAALPPVIASCCVVQRSKARSAVHLEPKPSRTHLQQGMFGQLAPISCPPAGHPFMTVLLASIPAGHEWAA